jgi:hypothetical protein
MSAVHISTRTAWQRLRKVLGGALLVLQACGSAPVDVLPSDLAGSRAAMLAGSYEIQLFSSVRSDIASVDGMQLPTSFMLARFNTVRLAAGTHWIETIADTTYHAPFGGYNVCTCAFDFEFRANHRYSLKAKSNVYDRPSHEQRRFQRYGGTVAVEESGPGVPLIAHSIPAVCTGGALSSFCRTDSDCKDRNESRCVLEATDKFGFCR